MKKLLFVSLMCICAMTSCNRAYDSQLVKSSFEHIEAQLPVAIAATEQRQAELTAEGTIGEGLRRKVVMRNITEDGSLGLVGASDWTSGFFPGLLWYTYEYSGDQKWAELADRYSRLIEEAKTRTTTHDLGFIIYCSFGNGYRLTRDEHYRDVIIEASNSLITRFNPTVGCIRSWDHHADVWSFPVIIDNMMNLEMLFATSKLTNDPIYRDIAISHANVTMANHFREDWSSYHVVNYDPATGEAKQHHTHQGYAHSSAWARGQAWGLYGYTMMYRETSDPRYLELANNIANFIFTHPNMPEDMVPYWDFNAPDIPNAPRDVSAAAIMASALYELSDYMPARALPYIATANHILESISTKYLSASGENYGFVTTNSTGHYPNNSEISVPINYADYYFAEALLRKNRLDRRSK